MSFVYAFNTIIFIVCSSILTNGGAPNFIGSFSGRVGNVSVGCICGGGYYGEYCEIAPELSGARGLLRLRWTLAASAVVVLLNALLQNGLLEPPLADFEPM